MDATRDGVAPAGAHEHTLGSCPECFVELQRDGEWWRARPEGARLVGLVVARDDLPPIVEQRADLARFGVSIHDFRHPAPERAGSGGHGSRARAWWAVAGALLITLGCFAAVL